MCITSIMAQSVYKVTSQRLNVRATPSANGLLIGTLNRGVTIAVERIENGWAVINYAGKICYVSAKYLSKEEHVENKDAESAPKSIQEQETTEQTDSLNTTSVTEKSVTSVKTKEKRRLISGSFFFPSGEGSFTDKLNSCIGWHHISLDGFGFEYVVRFSTARYGNKNIDLGPNYSYKLWENSKNSLYATAAICISSRVQGMPDIEVSSSGKVKESTKYKYFLDMVTYARVSYELPGVTLATGFVIWAPEFKFDSNYCKTGLMLSLLFPI